MGIQKFIRFSLIFFGLCWGLPVLAQPLPLPISPWPVVSLHPCLSHLAEPSGELGVTEVAGQTFAPLNTKPDKAVYSLGFSLEAPRLEVDYNTGEVKGDYLLQQFIGYTQQ